MGKLKAIYTGWKNYTFPNEEIENLAKERAETCSACEHCVKGSYQKLMPDYSLKEIQGMKCGECGCPLSTKLRQTTENCPIEKW